MLTIILLLLLSSDITMNAHEIANPEQRLIIFECLTEYPYRPKSEEFIFNDIHQKKTSL